MRPDATRDAGLRELGVHERLRRVAYGNDGSRRPHQERVRLLDEYKVELKADKTRFALELHPDTNADLPEKEREEKQQKFNRVIRAINFVLGLDVVPPPAPRPVMRVVIIPVRGGIHFGTSTTSTAGFWPDIIT